MDSKFLHTLAKRNVIGYKERFMDVGSLSAWTLVPMVLIARRCVGIYSHSIGKEQPRTPTIHAKHIIGFRIHTDNGP